MKYLLVLACLVMVAVGALIFGKQIYYAGYDAGRRAACTPAPSTGVNSVTHRVPAR